MNFYWLDQIRLDDYPQVGSKAFHLSHLAQQGLPVLSGVVISAQTLQTFLETIQWSDPLFADLPHSALRLDLGNADQLQAIAHQLRQRILSHSLSEQWLHELQSAVVAFDAPSLILRPSLAVWSTDARQARPDPVADSHSSALFQTQFCPNTALAIATGLKRLWADLFSARSLFYWQRVGIPLQQVHLAVLVQPLIDTIASGWMTAMGDRSQIAAIHGNGLALTRGEAQPTLYAVTAPNGPIQPQRTGYQTAAYRVATSLSESGSVLDFRMLDGPDQQPPPLTASHLEALVQLSHRLSAEVGNPFEVEWILGSAATSDFPYYLTQIIRQAYIPLESNPGDKTLSPHVSLANPLPTLTPPPLLTGLAASPGRAIAPAFILNHLDEPAPSPEPGHILVMPSLSLQWAPFLKHAAGIVTEQGSLTSHAAILAREIGIPAVVAAQSATHQIRPSELLLVDGNLGTIRRLSHSPAPASSPLALRVSQEPLTKQLAAAPLELPGRTQLMVNISQPESLDLLIHQPIDGIGLLRSDLLAISVLQGQHPQQWIEQGRRDELVDLLADALRPFTQVMQPRPVFYRSLDPGSDSWRTNPTRIHPDLGRRGTYSYQVDPTLFDLELTALAKVQQTGGDNLRLLLPFVRTVEEFQFCQQRVQQAGLMDSPSFQLWIMAEVPSVLFLLPEYVQAGVQGISIGTNDLMQLLLGIDRESGALASYLDERHPSLLAAIAHLVQQAKQLGIPCAICGQAPVRFPELVAPLIRWGITAISVEPDAVEATAQAIRQTEQILRASLPQTISDR